MKICTASKVKSPNEQQSAILVWCSFRTKCCLFAPASIHYCSVYLITDSILQACQSKCKLGICVCVFALTRCRNAISSSVNVCMLMPPMTGSVHTHTRKLIYWGTFTVCTCRPKSESVSQWQQTRVHCRSSALIGRALMCKCWKPWSAAVVSPLLTFHFSQNGGSHCVTDVNRLDQLQVCPITAVWAAPVPPALSLIGVLFRCRP